MKKITFLSVVLFLTLLTGCSKEQQDQINQYWDTQLKTLAKRVGISEEELASFRQARARRGGSRLLTPQQQEELMQALQQTQQDGTLNNTTPASGANKAVAKAPKPLDAMLFLSPTCPWCQRVKKEGFARKFQDKYDGQIVLKEYMLDKQENMAIYSQMVKKHKLSGGVPLLIIGSTPIQGYSEKLLEQASAVAEKELAKNNLQKLHSAAQNTPPVLQVSMEDEEIKGPASAEDKKKMKRMLLSLQESNGEMIQSIGATFGPVVKNQAMALAAKTEQKLKSVADQSADLASFTEQYDMLVLQHNQAMDQLMRKNTDKIRNVR